MVENEEIDYSKFDINSPRPRARESIDVSDSNEVTHSEYTGLLFPSGRVWDNMGKDHDFQLINPDAAIYLSAVLEYMTSEVLEIAGNAAKRSDKTRIEPPDILNAIKCDTEFTSLFGGGASKSRDSVPASPYDIIDRIEEQKRFADRSWSKLRFWAEADRESSTACTELGTEHKDTDDESEKVDDCKHEKHFFSFGQKKGITLEIEDKRDSEDDVDIIMDEEEKCESVDDEQLIPGLYYIDDFITDEQHDEILRFVNNNEWDKISCRIVQQYVNAEDVDKNVLSKIDKKPFDMMPQCVQDILDEIVNDEQFGIPKDYEFDQLTVNNYPNFGGISYHLDDTNYFDEYIICLSLLSEAVINFKNIETDQTKQVLLKPKSLLILSDDARYEWMHGIDEKDIHFYKGNEIHRQQRISLTFRKCIHLDCVENEFMNDDIKNDHDDKPVISTINTNQFLFKIDSLLDCIDAMDIK